MEFAELFTARNIRFIRPVRQLVLKLLNLRRKATERAIGRKEKCSFDWTIAQDSEAIYAEKDETLSRKDSSTQKRDSYLCWTH